MQLDAPVKIIGREHLGVLFIRAFRSHDTVFVSALGAPPGKFYCAQKNELKPVVLLDYKPARPASPLAVLSRCAAQLPEQPNGWVDVVWPQLPPYVKPNKQPFQRQAARDARDRIAGIFVN